MHVILDLVGEVEVDHQVDVLDVETARGDVGGHENGNSPGLELVDDPVALPLLLVAVNHGAHAPHGPPNLVAHALRSAEDDRLQRLCGRVTQHLHQTRLLLESPAHLHHLRDVLVRHQRIGVADVHLDRVGQDRRRDPHHCPGPRGGEEQRLSRGGRTRENLTNLRLETHVEHAICLVEDDVRGRAEVDGAGLEEVVETAGSGNGE